MKQCTEPGCYNNQFGGGYCKYHQFRRKMRGGDTHKRRTPIKKRSEKRVKDEKHYKDHCKELTEEIKKQNGGKIYCFFSGLEITGKPVYHHLRGRTGNFYTDKEWLVPCINEYHLAYHNQPVDKLLEHDWYDNVFLPNLKAKSEELYNKQTGKKEKSNQLNPRLFDDDD